MLRVEKLIWEKGDIEHIARYGVTTKEVEDVCYGSHVTRDAHHGRILIIGLTKKGKALAIILDPESEKDVYYPVTSRSADKKEREKYSQEMGVKL